MSLTLGHAAKVYRELLNNGAQSSLNIDILSKFVARAKSKDDQIACIDVAVSTPLRMCPMRSIVAQLVMWNRSKGHVENGLSDKTKSIAEYIKLMRGTGTALLTADTPLPEAIAKLKAARGSTTLLVQLMKERVLKENRDVRDFVTQYFTRVWKIEQIAEGRMIEALARKGGAKKSRRDKLESEKCWTSSFAMTKDPAVLVDTYRTGKAVQISGRLAVAPVKLNKTIYNTAADAFEALSGPVKRNADGVGRKNAVATLKLDGYSLNISFFKAGPVVRHSLSFRTKGNTCTIGAGMASIAAAIARALEDVDGFEQMIVGGEVLVMTDDDVPLPSIHMHDWNKPGFKLGFVAYHMVLYNDKHSGSIQDDMRALSDIFCPAFLLKASPANGFLTTIASTVGLKYAPASTIAMHAFVRSVEELDAYFKKVCDASLEGVVVTNRSSGLLIGSRNPNILKMKPQRVEVSVVVYGFKTRSDGRIKEVLVGVSTKDGCVVAYATVGNLTDDARRHLRELFTRRKFNVAIGYEVVALPAWLRSGPPKPDFHYMMPAEPGVLPKTRLVGYPSKHVTKACGIVPEGVPPSLTFPKLVQSSVASLMGVAVRDKKSWSENPFEMKLEELKGKEADSTIFENKVVELSVPDVKDKLEYDNALEVATELVRNSAIVVMASTVEHSDYTINTENDAEWSWVFQCVVAGQILPFPQGDQPVAVTVTCPHCGKEI
jgi:hypothetical protein